jgi:tetratricopeptide (TPR) repeat protein
LLVFRALSLLAGVLMGGCVGTPRIAPQEQTPAAAGSGSAAIDGYVAAIKSASERTDHEPDAKVRANLATEASSKADACLVVDPHAAACQYGKAVATGLEARAHPARAVGLLGSMLQNLETAESTDPNYDKAGPARVRALVLMRAPGWPLGPGDTDAGLAAARRAVALQPDYPPNILALAEALSKTGDANGARENYTRARDLAQALPAGPERQDWLRDAGEGLKHR